MQLQLHRLSKQVEWQCKLNFVKSIEDRVSTRLSSLRGWTPRQWTPRLCHALPYSCASHKSINKTTSSEARENMPSSMFRSPSFFSLLQESSQVPTNQTQGSSNSTIRPGSQSVSSEAFWTPNTASSNCPKQVHEVKVRQINNQLSSPSLFS